MLKIEKNLEKHDPDWFRSSPKSKIVNNLNQSNNALKQIGLPAIIRPAFTLGGLGGGIAKNKKRVFQNNKNGLHEFTCQSRLVEECLEGWKEFDGSSKRQNDNCIIIYVQ